MLYESEEVDCFLVDFVQVLLSKHQVFDNVDERLGVGSLFVDRLSKPSAEQRFIVHFLCDLAFLISCACRSAHVLLQYCVFVRKLTTHTRLPHGLYEQKRGSFIRVG